MPSSRVIFSSSVSGIFSLFIMRSVRRSIDARILINGSLIGSGNWSAATLAFCMSDKAISYSSIVLRISCLPCSLGSSSSSVLNLATSFSYSVLCSSFNFILAPVLFKYAMAKRSYSSRADCGIYFIPAFALAFSANVSGLGPNSPCLYAASTPLSYASPMS